MGKMVRGRADREYRYGARAFFTLKGYASRDSETESASFIGARSHRRGSRLRWEDGRREAATWASVCSADQEAETRQARRALAAV